MIVVPVRDLRRPLHPDGEAEPRVRRPGVPLVARRKPGSAPGEALLCLLYEMPRRNADEQQQRANDR